MHDQVIKLFLNFHYAFERKFSETIETERFKTQKFTFFMLYMKVTIY